MTLGLVIRALVEKTLPPYRNSVLTRLLQESLGGNSETLMLAAISPSSYNHSETVGTLRYANSAKQIKNKVVINEDENQRMISSLKDEILRLKEELSQRGPGSVPTEQVLQKQAELDRKQVEFDFERQKIEQQWQEMVSQRESHLAELENERKRELEKLDIEKEIQRVQHEKEEIWQQVGLLQDEKDKHRKADLRDKSRLKEGKV